MTSSKLKLSILKRQFVDSNAPEIILAKAEIEELTIQIKEQREKIIDPKVKIILQGLEF